MTVFFSLLKSTCQFAHLFMDKTFGTEMVFSNFSSNNEPDRADVRSVSVRKQINIVILFFMLSHVLNLVVLHTSLYIHNFIVYVFIKGIQNFFCH